MSGERERERRAQKIIRWKTIFLKKEENNLWFCPILCFSSFGEAELFNLGGLKKRENLCQVLGYPFKRKYKIFEKMGKGD